MVGKKPRGRPRMGMIDDLKEGSYTEMKRRAEDRDKWRAWMPRTCRKRRTNDDDDTCRLTQKITP
jgi:hypothetical protein